jgi:hypothetical protein
MKVVLRVVVSLLAAAAGAFGGLVLYVTLRPVAEDLERLITSIWGVGVTTGLNMIWLVVLMGTFAVKAFLAVFGMMADTKPQTPKPDPKSHKQEQKPTFNPFRQG